MQFKTHETTIQYTNFVQKKQEIPHVVGGSKKFRKSSFENIGKVTTRINHHHFAASHLHAQNMTYEKELRLLLKGNNHAVFHKKQSAFIDSDRDVCSVPEQKNLQRIFTIINECKSAAYELYQTLISTNWKDFKRWFYQLDRKLSLMPPSLPELGRNQDHFMLLLQRRTLIQILDKLIQIAYLDFRNESFKQFKRVENLTCPSQCCT